MSLQCLLWPCRQKLNHFRGSRGSLTTISILTTEHTLEVTIVGILAEMTGKTGVHLGAGRGT
jgi:hypothetical protein